MTLGDLLHVKLAPANVRSFAPDFIYQEASADMAAVQALMSKWGILVKGGAVPEDLPTIDDCMEQCKAIKSRAKDLEMLADMATTRASK